MSGFVIAMPIACRSGGRERWLVTLTRPFGPEADEIALGADGRPRLFESETAAREAGRALEPPRAPEFEASPLVVALRTVEPRRADLDAMLAWCARPDAAGFDAKALAFAWQLATLAGTMPPLRRLDPMYYAPLEEERLAGTAAPGMDEKLIAMKLTFTVEHDQQLRAGEAKRAARGNLPDPADDGVGEFMLWCGRWSDDDRARLARVLGPGIADLAARLD